MDDYFLIEQLSPGVRHEYLDGEILAMAGGSLDHNRIAANVLRGLSARLGGRCEVLGSDLRLQAPSGLYTYADVVVVCGEPALAPGRADTLVNPTAVIEVLSPSTRDYDQGDKLEHYRSIPTLQHVALIEPEAARVVVWSREDGTWTAAPSDGLDAAARLLDVDLSLREIYARTGAGAG